MVNIFHKLKNILIGTYRNIFNKKPEFAKQRIEICDKCEFEKGKGRTRYCSKCLCIIESKASVEDEFCWENKW